MTFYRVAGMVPPKRFTKLQTEDGRFIHEELMSSQGFGSVWSLLYRLNAPTRVASIEPIEGHELVEWDTRLVDKHLFNVNHFDSKGDFFESRHALAFNDQIVLSLARVTSDMEDRFYRNSFHDEAVLVVEGRGVLKTIFGNISYGPLDLIYIPRGTTIQWVPEGGPELLVVVESVDPIVPPDRYRIGQGQFLPRAPYHERDLRLPELDEPIDVSGEFPIMVRTERSAARYVVERHPFSVVGWDGYLYPFALNLDDFEITTGRIHGTPDLGEILSTPGAAICAGLPHRSETDPLSMPTPPHHDNLDYDEIVFSLPAPGGASDPLNPRAGMLWVHGRSFPHGPPPGFENWSLPEQQTSYAFMVDTLRPMKIAQLGSELNVDNYYSEFYRQQR